MKCIDDCHTYELDRVREGIYLIHFYEMKEDGLVLDGITNEEVLRMLIHRIKYLNYKWADGKFNCQENTEAIMALEYALRQLDKRTADRKQRGVEGTFEP